METADARSFKNHEIKITLYTAEIRRFLRYIFASNGCKKVKSLLNTNFPRSSIEYCHLHSRRLIPQSFSGFFHALFPQVQKIKKQACRL